MNLRDSHYQACSEAGMTDAEIEADWAVTERELAEYHPELSKRIRPGAFIIRWFRSMATFIRIQRQKWTAKG